MHLPAMFWVGFGCGVLFVTICAAFAMSLAVAADRKPPKPAPRLRAVEQGRNH
jgi:hypothetical protein